MRSTASVMKLVAVQRAGLLLFVLRFSVVGTRGRGGGGRSSCGVPLLEKRGVPLLEERAGSGRGVTLLEERRCRSVVSVGSEVRRRVVRRQTSGGLSEKLSLFRWLRLVRRRAIRVHHGRLFVKRLRCGRVVRGRRRHVRWPGGVIGRVVVRRRWWWRSPVHGVLRFVRVLQRPIRIAARHQHRACWLQVRADRLVRAQRLIWIRVRVRISGAGRATDGHVVLRVWIVVRFVLSRARRRACSCTRFLK